MNNIHKVVTQLHFQVKTVLDSIFLVFQPLLDVKMHEKKYSFHLSGHFWAK